MLKKHNHESGQILIGGLFFLFLAAATGWYFISVSNLIDKLYSSTLKSRIETINQATIYANIFNQIAMNNQLIITEIMTSQTAYIAAVESGLVLSHQQPYWETYALFKDSKNLSALSAESSQSIQDSFRSYTYISGRGFYAAKALASKNDLLIKQLPINIQQHFVQSTNSFVHCIALELQKNELNPSSYYPLQISTFKKIGLIKKDCSLYEKNRDFLTKITNSLPMLTAGDDDLIIAFELIDKYSNFKQHFSYGISYVPPHDVYGFIDSLKFDSKSTLKTIIRISHPDFFCTNKHFFYGDFVEEDDWKTPCKLSVSHFLRTFLKPNWAAFITHQENRMRYK